MEVKGKVTVLVDGESIACEADGITILHGGGTREGKTDSAGQPVVVMENGYRVPGINVTRITTKNFSAAKLINRRGMTVMVKQEGGGWMLSGALLANQVDIDVRNANAPLNFIGDKLEEL